MDGLIGEAVREQLANELLAGVLGSVLLVRGTRPGKTG